jgi:uncharacterized protein (DUF1330 family)
MAAYVVSEVEALDEEMFRRYRKLAAESIAVHDGRYLVRGADPETAEGELPAGRRIVIVEFPDRTKLHDWYRSVEYAHALAVRDVALRRLLFFVDGVQEPPGAPV